MKFHWFYEKLSFRLLPEIERNELDFCSKFAMIIVWSIALHSNINATICFPRGSKSLGREHNSHLVLMAAALCYQYHVLEAVFVQTSTLSWAIFCLMAQILSQATAKYLSLWIRSTLNIKLNKIDSNNYSNHPALCRASVIWENQADDLYTSKSLRIF